MRVYIPEDMVFDGYLGEPHEGKILTGLGVKLSLNGQDGPQQIALSGLVIWSRIDRVNGLTETEMEVDGISLLTQEHVFGMTAPDVGSTREVLGVPLGVRDYEYDDFELPDVRMDWTVDAVARWQNFFMVDLHPVEFRFQATSGNQK